MTGAARARRLALLGVAGSAALLLAAFGFQHLGELAPCPLCVWQRWPHVAAILLGGTALALPGLARPALALAALALLAGAVLGVYHAGVEQGWWQGPGTCSAGPVGGLSTEDLIAQIMAAPLVRCDEIVWSLLGLSMAGWNALWSLGLAGLFGYASSSASQ